MEARPCQIVEFFDGTKQMMVPLFQRPYEWEEKHWRELWEDLLEQYERQESETIAPHFTGAIVTAPAKSNPVGVSKYLVIDGQQRMTTVSILICAVRSLLDPTTPKYRKLSKLLINEDDEGLDYYKLLPTQPDRLAFQQLIALEPVLETRFADAFEFFRKKIQGTDSDGNAIQVERLIETVQTRLTVVAIHLSNSDDPYLIFESLNAKGAPLTQADLIRNYLLLRLHSENQQKVYEAAWLPMQTRLQGDHLTEFMRVFLMMDGEWVGKSSIYTVLKTQVIDVNDGNISEYLHRMQRLSQLYSYIVGLAEFADAEVASRLNRLRRWEVATANPLILKMLEWHSVGKISSSEVQSALDAIESFVIRRAVCGAPTNQLKRVFLALVKDLPEESPSAQLIANLAAGTSGRRWPKDDELERELLRYRAYSNPVDRCKLLLESIETSYGHKETIDFGVASIEHVMPQTLNEDWVQVLGEGASGVHERWKDLLSNLTLSGYNSELSNYSFIKKRPMLQSSNFMMNRWIAEQTDWTEVQMEERSQILFGKMKNIWKRPS